MNDITQRQDEEFFAACALASEYSKAINRTVEVLGLSPSFEQKIMIIASLLHDRSSNVIR